MAFIPGTGPATAGSRSCLRWRGFVGMGFCLSEAKGTRRQTGFAILRAIIGGGRLGVRGGFPVVLGSIVSCLNRSPLIIFNFLYRDANAPQSLAGFQKTTIQQSANGFHTEIQFFGRLLEAEEFPGRLRFLPEAMDFISQLFHFDNKCGNCL